jgi:hypothetical protein
MPALIDTRLAYLRYTTKTYINDDPTTIVLKRQTKVSKPGGGHDYPKIDQSPQNFRLINQDVGSGISYSSDDDIARKFNYVLIGEYDANVLVNDTWTEDGIQYSVESVIPNNGFETRAYVTGFATKPEHG